MDYIRFTNRQIKNIDLVLFWVSKKRHEELNFLATFQEIDYAWSAFHYNKYDNKISVEKCWIAYEVATKELASRDSLVSDATLGKVIETLKEKLNVGI